MDRDKGRHYKYSSDISPIKQKLEILASSFGDYYDVNNVEKLSFIQRLVFSTQVRVQELENAILRLYHYLYNV